MRIIYVSNSRIPTEKAYGVSIVKTCSALAQKGAEVLLVAPRVRNTAGEDLFSFYDVPRNFTVRYIPAIDAVTWGWRYGFLLNQISFAFALFFLFRSRRGDVLITRDEASAFLFWLKRVSVFYDMHGFPERKLWIWKFILRRASGIFTTNEWKVNECNKHFHIPREKMVVARNGFDPALFASNESREALRKKLSLPEGKPIVLYTGHLYDWKGVFVLAEAARLLPGAFFVFIGGTYYDREAFEKRYGDVSNIVLVGHKPHVEIPMYLKAADVLVLPNSAAPGKDPRFSAYSRNDTSPIKLFEYMASGRPIVASDLPSLREILNDENALFAHPDDAEDLKRGIEKLLKDEAVARTLAENAQNDVKKYTWEKRADLMLEFIESSL